MSKSRCAICLKNEPVAALGVYVPYRTTNPEPVLNARFSYVVCRKCWKKMEKMNPIERTAMSMLVEDNVVSKKAKIL